MSSSSGSNHNYTYGGQEPYTIDSKEYMQPPVPRTSHSISNTIFRETNEEEEGEEEEQEQQTVPVVSAPAVPETNLNGCINDDQNNRPLITAALLKDDMHMTSATTANGVAEDDGEPCRLMSDILAEETHTEEEKHIEDQIKLGNGAPEIKATTPIKVSDPITKEPESLIIISNEMSSLPVTIENGETYDSLAYLPDPPSSEEIKQLNDVVINLENNTMDSLPPPPPPEIMTTVVATAVNADGHNGSVASIES